jgi:hypothetical protein
MRWIGLKLLNIFNFELLLEGNDLEQSSENCWNLGIVLVLHMEWRTKQLELDKNTHFLIQSSIGIENHILKPKITTIIESCGVL